MDEKKVRPVQRPTITLAEMAQYEADAEKAKELLEAPEFKFFRDFLVGEKEAIVTDFVNNNIHETVEKKKYPDGTELLIKHTKEEQSNELTGRFKFIFELIAKLEQVRDLPKQALEAQDAGKLIIGEPKKNE